MAYLLTPKSEEEIKKTSVSQVRKDYLKLADTYMKIVDNKYAYCKKCGQFLSQHAFYQDKRYADNCSIYCKDCIKKIAYQQKKDTDPIKETPESIREVCKLLDKPFINKVYESCRSSIENSTGERTKESILNAMIPMLSTLPQYERMTYKNSDISETEQQDTEDKRIIQKVVKAGRKRFGDYPEDDLMFLEQEYEDWIARYPCDSKSQELLFQRLCCQTLDADKAQKAGNSTKDIDKAIQDTMTALGIKPSQSKADAMADNMTFGMLIDKWESEGKPIPEPEEEFKDPDKIGSYIDIFFKGHLAKSMGLRNAFSQIYEKFMSKYSVKRPDIDEETEEVLFNQIFGHKLDDGD